MPLVELAGFDAAIPAFEPLAVLEVRPRTGRVDVERPHDQDHEQHRTGEQQDLPDRLAAEIIEHTRELQPDVGEHEALQQQIGREPERLLLLTRRVVGARGVIPDVQPHRDDREDTRSEQVLGDRVSAERSEQPERADHDGVADAHAQLVQDDAEHETDGHTDPDRHQELPDAAPDRDGRAGEDRGEHAVQRQRGRVVDEALAREHGHDAAWQPEPTADSRSRHRVGRGDDRAEEQCARKCEGRQDPPRDEADRERRDQHEPDAESADLRQAALESDE
jgi:hypothetical protein